MSRRVQPTIEEDFDDDTDLLLPSRPLPNTGLRGALLQEVSDDEDDEEDEDEDDIGGAAQLMRPTAGAGPASPSQGGGFGLSQQGAQNTISDLTPYKKCVAHIHSLHHVHKPSLTIAADGHASIPFTLTLSAPTAPAYDAFRARRASGGP